MGEEATPRQLALKSFTEAISAPFGDLLRYCTTDGISTLRKCCTSMQDQSWIEDKVCRFVLPMIYKEIEDFVYGGDLLSNGIYDEDDAACIILSALGPTLTQCFLVNDKTGLDSSHDIFEFATATIKAFIARNLQESAQNEASEPPENIVEDFGFEPFIEELIEEHEDLEPREDRKQTELHGFGVQGDAFEAGVAPSENVSLSVVPSDGSFNSVTVNVQVSGFNALKQEIESKGDELQSLRECLECTNDMVQMLCDDKRSLSEKLRLLKQRLVKSTADLRAANHRLHVAETARATLKTKVAELMRHFDDESRVVAPTLPLIHHCRMSPIRLRMAVRCASIALRECPSHTDVARKIAADFDDAFGPKWNCIVGSQPSSSNVAFDEGCYACFSIGAVRIELFKYTGNTGLPVQVVDEDQRRKRTLETQPGHACKVAKCVPAPVSE